MNDNKFPTVPRAITTGSRYLIKNIPMVYLIWRFEGMAAVIWNGARVENVKLVTFSNVHSVMFSMFFS